MGGVGGEPALALHCARQFVEHDVERVCEFADLVVGTMVGDAG